MASDGMACRILIQNEQREQMDKWRKYVLGVANPLIEDG